MSGKIGSRNTKVKEEDDVYRDLKKIDSSLDNYEEKN